MIRRIIRKNKKRRDPRYFLHEDLETPADEPTTNPAPLKTAPEQTADSAQQQAAQQDDKPETLTVANVTGAEEKTGARLMYEFVKKLMAENSNLTVNDLERALRALQPPFEFAEPEEGGTQTAAVTSPVEAPSVTGGLV